MSKGKEQLGVDPSTARNKLTKDLLFYFICETGKNVCFHCGLKMERSDFSIEHKIPWLDSDKPKELFFDMDNISFSHLSCNSRAARRKGRACGTLTNYDKHGCRCSECKFVKAENRKKYYSPERRRLQYETLGN